MAFRSFIVLFWLLLVPGMASATSLSPYKCQVYFGSEQDAPKAVADILQSHPDDAVSICSLPITQGSEVFTLLSMPVRGLQGACSFSQQQIFKPNEARAEWHFKTPPEPPTVRMAPPSQPCPRQDDLAYIPTSNISEDLFLQLTSYWQKIVATGNAELFAGWSARSEFHEFKTQALQEPSRQSVRLTRIWISAKPDGGGPSLYGLDIYSRSGSWTLWVDFTSAGIRFVKLGTIS